MIVQVTAWKWLESHAPALLKRKEEEELFLSPPLSDTSVIAKYFIYNEKWDTAVRERSSCFPYPLGLV